MIKLLTGNKFNTSFTPLNNETKLKVVVPVIIFLILNTLKITIYSLYIIPSHEASIFIYKFGLTLMMSFLVYPIVFKFKSFMPLLSLYILQTIYITVNISYYLYYHNYLHVMQMITLFKEAFISAGHSSSPMSPQLLVAFIDLPILIYVLFKYSSVKQFFSGLPFKGMFLIVSSFLIILCIEGINYAHGDSIIQYSDSIKGDESQIVEKYGTLVNNVVSLYTNDGCKQLTDYLEHSKNVSGKAEAKNTPNFVIIQVESMDSNVINQKYKGQYIAPFLHSLSQQSIYYPYVLSYHMGGGTSDSEFSIINSVEPLPDYPAIKLDDYDYANSLIKKLSAASYNTMAFHGNIGYFYNRSSAFPKMGFGDFFDLEKMDMEDTGWGAPDNDVFNYAANHLNKSRQPLMSYIITMTSHTPFTNAKNYYNNNIYDDIEDDTVRNYFNSISYVDRSIGDFISKLQSELKNTYFFIIGDHTPSINKDSYQQASFIMDNKYFEFVPLIIITPDNKVYKEDKSVASFLDISPTILYASGINFNMKSNGQDLINSNNYSKTISFKGSLYDRKLLYSKINSSR